MGLIMQINRHDEYRPSLINHLLTVTLRHWDSTVRELGAKSLRKICELDLSHLGPECALKIVRFSLLHRTCLNVHSITLF